MSISDLANQVSFLSVNEEASDVASVQCEKKETTEPGIVISMKPTAETVLKHNTMPATNARNILYYALELSPTSRQFLLELKQVRDRVQEYKLNAELHSTVLYVGGQSNSNIASLTGLVGQEYCLSIDRVAISAKFVTFGIESIFDDMGELPYFGNPIKHLTTGITRKPLRDLAPVNSPTAFAEGEVITFRRPFVVTGTLKEVKKH